MKLNLINLSKPHRLDFNGNPMPAALREAADAFEELARLNVALDMRSDRWSARNPCGTPCSHAGAFAVAAGIEYDGIFDKGHYIHLCATNSFSVHLGFSDEREYRRWAHDNPGAWGGQHGAEMFMRSGDVAISGGVKTTMQTLADHYRGVADRLEAMH